MTVTAIVVAAVVAALAVVVAALAAVVAAVMGDAVVEFNVVVSFVKKRGNK